MPLKCQLDISLHASHILDLNQLFQSCHYKYLGYESQHNVCCDARTNESCGTICALFWVCCGMQGGFHSSLPHCLFELNLQSLRYGHVEKIKMRNGLDSKYEIIMYKDRIVDHKQVYDRNYVCLLHSYINLCFCLHKYFFTFLFSIYNQYVIPFS